MAQVVSVCISEIKGTKKHPVVKYQGAASRHRGRRACGRLAPAGESARKRERGPDEKRRTDARRRRLCGKHPHRGGPADALIGTVLRAGEVRLEVTQIGKECHNDCEIRRLTGMCVMPTDGIFAVVLNEGVIRPGDQIEVESI